MFFRLGMVTGIWQIPTPIPPHSFAGYFSQAFSAPTFVLKKPRYSIGKALFVVEEKPFAPKLGHAKS
jgi:hypothetical protein